MTKRDVLNAMIKKMEEYDKIVTKTKFNSALEISQMHHKYINEALKIATDNGYNDGTKWQLWEKVMDERERKLNVKPNPIF